MLRDIPEDVMLKIDEQARKKHMSRNKFLVQQLSLLAQSPELFSKEDKYEKLLNTIITESKENRKAIEENKKAMEELSKKL